MLAYSAAFCPAPARAPARAPTAAHSFVTSLAPLTPRRARVTLHGARQRAAVRASATSPPGPSSPTPPPTPTPPAVDPRGINGTAAFYLAILAAQALPFVEATSGILGDAVYFIVTAMSSIVIGVRRAPLEPPELSAAIESKQALAAPFTASVFLFGTYLLLKYTALDVNLLFNLLTTLSGTLCLKESLDPVFHSVLTPLSLQDVVVIPGSKPADSPTSAAEPASETPAATSLSSDAASTDGEEASDSADAENEGRPPFMLTNLLATASALTVTGLYLSHASPNFVFSNMIAVALCTRILSLIRPSSFLVASGLLAGLFCYDIFWVFGSEVMVSVATQIDSPGKLLFPRGGVLDAARQTDYPYAILGLGDVCVPGIFIALAQTLDKEFATPAAGSDAGSGPQQSSPYFTASIVAYVAALLTCFGVNLYTNAAQPALLYLVPALIASTLGMAAVRGELGDVIKFKEGKREGAAAAGEKK